MNDLVSIIMPCFNTGKYIAGSIRSVLSQTYINWELLIVDDLSTDNTNEIILSFNDVRIRYFKNDINRGAAFSRNKALSESRGRWIAFLDSDDLWVSDKLEKQIYFMEINNYVFSYTNYTEINEDSEPLKILISGPKRITKFGMHNYCWPGCLTVMYDVRVVGLIQIENIEKNNDYAMWLKVCMKANCYLLNEELAMYRRRNGSISNHNYVSLIKWHYKLYRLVEKQNIFLSIVSTFRNLGFGAWKKIKYVKKYR